MRSTRRQGVPAIRRANRYWLAITLLLCCGALSAQVSDRGGAGFEDFSALSQSDLTSEIRRVETSLPTVTDGTRRFQLQRRIADLQLELATRVDRPYDHARAALTIYNRQLSFRTFPAQEAELLYRSAYAAELAGDFSAGIVALTRLIANYPNAELVPEAYFRRAEMRFVTGSYGPAEGDYGYLVPLGRDTAFFIESLYKRGWSRYRQRDYRGALQDQARVVAEVLGRTAVTPRGRFDFSRLSLAQKSIVEDAIRNIVLDLAALGDRYSVARFVSDAELAAYDYALSRRLMAYWREIGRPDIAALEAGQFVERNPTHPSSDELRLVMIESLEQTGQPAQVIPAKKAFVKRYGLENSAWQDQPSMQQPAQRERIEAYAREITQWEHAQAQRTGQPAAYDEAARWYEHYLTLFPQTTFGRRVPLLMGDLLLESGRADAAARSYQRAAYDTPDNPEAAEAALAGVLALRKAAGSGFASDAGVEAASIRFASQFPDHPQATAVLANLAEARYDARDLEAAGAMADRVLAHQPPASPAVRRSALQIQAAAASQTGQYAQAEAALRQRLALASPEESALWREHLARAIYRQGEAQLQAGEPAAAGQTFLRLVEEMPAQGEAASRIRATAMYDAANAFGQAGQSELSLSILERFRSAYPQHPRAQDANNQLATGYLDSGNNERALEELRRLLNQPGVDTRTRRDATLEIGRLQVETGQYEAASRTYKDFYYRGDPSPEEALELQGRLINLYVRSGDKEKADYWREQIIQTDRQNSTATSRTLAAEAALSLADDARLRYEDITLTVPLQRSLAAKRAAFQTALEAYARADDYGIASVSTAAAFHTASLYLELHDALVQAPRPAGMTEEQALEYEQAINARALPFRSDGVDILQANLQRADRVAADDPWIAQSRERLRALEPAQFSRTERLGDAVIRRP